MENNQQQTKKIIDTSTSRAQKGFTHSRYIFYIVPGPKKGLRLGPARFYEASLQIFGVRN